MPEREGELQVGRAKELDEFAARAQAAVGGIRLDRDAIAADPLAYLTYPGRAPVSPAGPRAAQPAAATTGRPPHARHAWVPIGPRNLAGRVRAIACADPATALVWYAGSAGGGVWKTTDGGRRWTPLWHGQPSLAIGALAVAPSRAQRVYAATGEALSGSVVATRGHGVHVSDDAGATWTNHGAGSPPAANPAHRGGFEAIAVHPTTPDHCWAAGRDGLFRTLTGGADWERFAAGTHFTDVAFSGDTLYAVRGTSTGGEGVLLRLDAPAAGPAAVTAALASADSLSVVVPARPPHLPWPSAGRVAIAASDPDIAYVRFTTEDERHLGVFRTTNARAPLGRNVTWARLRDHPQWLDEGQGEYNLCIAVDPTDPARVATGMVYLHVSTNATAAAAAVRWHRVMAWELNDEGLRAHHADQHDLVIAGAPPALWVADDGGIARCPDWASAAGVDHGRRFRPDPVRPVPPGAVHWQERDNGIGGAQFYDLGQSPLVPGALAGGLQDNGTHLRVGGLTWRQVFGADGGFAAFDPDDPFRLFISYYAGLVALQFPALLDRLFADGVRDAGAASFRFLEHGAQDPAPFVPETARHPTRTGRLLHARDGRLYGAKPGSGDRLAVEPAGRSFELRFFADPAAPAAALELEIADTPAAIGLGLAPGRWRRPERNGIPLYSRLPAPYRLAEDDRLRVTLNGTAREIRFRAAEGIDPTRVQVRDVVRLLTAALPANQFDAFPLLWDIPTIVQVSTRGTGPAQTLRLDGNALDPLPDGLSRLGLNRGTYRGDDGRPASVLLGFAGFTDEQRRTNRDLSTPPGRTLTVAVNGGPARSVTIEAPVFHDPAHVSTGELAAALATALGADPDPARRVDVAAVPAVAAVDLVAAAGTRVVLTGTAADRFRVAPPGAPRVRLGVQTLAGRHLGLHRRNRASVDVRPPGVDPLQLRISDGTNTTGPLRFTAADVADLGSVTVEELHRLLRIHLAAHPAVQVRIEPFYLPLQGYATALAFSPANPQEAWAGTIDGGLYVTRDDGATWDDVGDPAWRLHDRQVETIAVHPSDAGTVYVGLAGEAQAATDRGFLFRTRAGGAPWQLLGHRVVSGRAEGVASDGLPLGVNAVQLDPGNPSVVLAATDAGVFRSDDAGDTWAPAGEGLPNVPIVDLVTEPTTRVMRAAAWTRGVYERRLDDGPPADARLLVRATELDDGTRPARQGPALGAPSPGPLPLASPDIKVVRRRPDVGTDAEMDGVVFDLDLPHDDVVAGETSDVVVQVTNLGALPVPPAVPPPAADLVRVVVLWARADAGPAPLPGDLFTRLAAGPLAGPVGHWTVGGDGTVPRAIGPGDTGIRSFQLAWPALDGVHRIGLLVLVTAPADPLAPGPFTVTELLAAERQAAYREVPVRRAEQDRTLVLLSTDGRDIVVEQPAAAPGVTGVGDRLGFAAGDLGTAGRVRVAAPAGAATYDLAVPGPAVVLRSAAPQAADLDLFPQASETDDDTSVPPWDVAAIVNARAGAAGLPVTAATIPVGVSLSCQGDARVRVTGGAAAARLGWAPMAPGAAVDFLPSTQTVAWFNLAGAAALALEVRASGAAFPVAVDLAPEHFADPAVADPDAVATLVNQAFAAAQVGGLIECFANRGLVLRGICDATVAVADAGAATLGLPAGPDSVLASAPGRVDLSPGPTLHVEVTPRVIVRFDGDPADIPDLGHAHPADVRRAVNLACELASVPVRAEVPTVGLRIAASPGDTARVRPVSGGPHLAELAASPNPIVGDPQAQFRLRQALGRDTLRSGATNHLYLRVVNSGNVPAAATRLRLFSLDMTATPVTATQFSTTVVDVPAGPAHVQSFTWDPGGAARTQTVLAVADHDVAGRRLDPPLGGFPTPADAAAFAAANPAAVLRTFEVVGP